MRFVCISDTHGLYASLPDLPDADGIIHAGYSFEYQHETLHINASICTESYAPINKPIAFDIDSTTKEVFLA